MAITAPLTAALVGLSLLLPTGFAMRTPGPTEDTLGTQARGDGDPIPLVSITGAPSYPSTGRLLLTTVGVSGGPIRELFPMDVLVGWAARARAILPVEAVFDMTVTREEQAQASAFQMITSKEAATAAALSELGFELPALLSVAAIAEESAALDVLYIDDQLIALNGTPITSHASLLADLAEIEPGDVVTLTVNRDGEPVDVEVVTGQAETIDGGTRASLGVLVNSQFDFPVTVDIQIENIGGPSAGMMFALAIIDRLTPEDELNGITIAGTGTVDLSGNIGPIGGIEQKLQGALRDGASWFFAPAGNCDEVLGNIPTGLRVVRVETLHEARAAMEAIGMGDPDGLPSCSDPLH